MDPVCSQGGGVTSLAEQQVIAHLGFICCLDHCHSATDMHLVVFAHMSTYALAHD